MHISIKPRIFVGYTEWQQKNNGVVLVEKEEDIEPLWKLLCEQDVYWEDYKDLIKVAPKEIDSEGDIAWMCQWCGNTDIADVAGLQKKIPFLIYQRPDEDWS